MTLADIIRRAHGRAGSNGAWRVERDDPADPFIGDVATLWHYSTPMLRWKISNPSDARVLDWSIGHGSVSDQGGMNTAFRVLGNKFQMTGTEHIPTSGGVLLAFNHIGYVDFVYDGLAAQPSKRLVRFMGKRELFDHKFTGPIMRGCHHIEVDRAKRR